MVESLRSHPDRREAFNLNGAYPYFEHLTLQAEGKLDVWGVRWYASMFTAGGLCLYPGQSLVQNIGMDGTGVHCGHSSYFEVDLSDFRPVEFPRSHRRVHDHLRGHPRISHWTANSGQERCDSRFGFPTSRRRR